MTTAQAILDELHELRAFKARAEEIVEQMEKRLDSERNVSYNTSGGKNDESDNAAEVGEI